MSYKQLAIKYHCSIRTIQRYIDKIPKTTPPTQKNIYLNILADTTFFGREFGILVLMDSLSKTVIYHQIVKTEKDIYYKVAMNKLREQGYIIQSVTCDGRRGLLKDMWGVPTQMCQFHLIAIVMRVLRKKHKSLAGRELKKLVKKLTEYTKNECYLELHYWYIKHKDYLNERSENPNEKGYYPYKHRSLRSAYSSLKRYIDYAFTYEKYPEFNIERTTSRLEGIFGELKRKLNNHSGLKKKCKLLFINEFLNKYSH